MAKERIQVSTVLPASPGRVYLAWLDAEEHSAFTGGKANVDPVVGGRFSAWDGYIEGMTIEVDPGKRILQTWRTSEFPKGHNDSRLEVGLEAVNGGTRLTVRHWDIPEGQGQKYKTGWVDHYFEPMKQYFTTRGAGESTFPTAAEDDDAKPGVGAKPGVVKARPKARPAAKTKRTKLAAKRVTAKKAARASAKKPVARKAAKKSAKKPAKKAAARKPARKAAAKKRARGQRRTARR